MAEMLKCPGCSLELPADALRVQSDHMKKYHPEIIAARLRKYGLDSAAEEYESGRVRQAHSREWL